jgi:anti-anti-sigma regulatory factor/HAMP domain-containing protein
MEVNSADTISESIQNLPQSEQLSAADDPVEQPASDRDEATEPSPAARVTSVRAHIGRGTIIIIVLLLVTIILTSAAFFLMDRAIVTVEAEMDRANAALEVGQAAGNLFTALAQGAISQDLDSFTQAFDEIIQTLLSAEKHLTESIGPLPQNDPMQIALARLETSTASILNLADHARREAEAERWWQVESLTTAGIPQYRDLMVESIEQMQSLTAERRTAAAAEAKTARQVMQVAPVVLMLMIIAVALRTGFVTLRSIAGPVERLAAAADRLAAGNLEERVPPEQVDEFIRLASAFNEMADRLQVSHAQLEQQLVDLEQETAERERAESEHKRLQREIIETQKQAIQDLSTPVIPVMDQIIVMPLVGNIDTMRARDITRRLLEGIRTHEASVVILDITGVPIVDSGVAEHLNKTIQAARLKGARTIVTGISDAVAETIVDLGIDWRGIETLSNLQSGLVAALDSVGIKLTR